MKEILIVEDERALRDALRHSLEAAGYAVRVARDGVRGWRSGNGNVPTSSS